MKATRYFTLTLLTFVILAFVSNSFAQDDSPELVVQVIYFHPNDREPHADIDTVLDTLMKDVQQFYADEMERHGFGRKTFRLEIDRYGCYPQMDNRIRDRQRWFLYLPQSNKRRNIQSRQPNPNSRRRHNQRTPYLHVDRYHCETQYIAYYYRIEDVFSHAVRSRSS